jgi:hypothetical protein
MLQVQDKKLSFWIIVLLVLLTNPLDPDVPEDQKTTLETSLEQYKLSFVKSECLTILVIHIADFFKIEREKRFEAHYQMLEYCLSLIRNLLTIKDLDKEETVHHRLLLTMVR